MTNTRRIAKAHAIRISNRFRNVSIGRDSPLYREQTARHFVDRVHQDDSGSGIGPSSSLKPFVHPAETMFHVAVRCRLTDCSVEPGLSCEILRRTSECS